MTVPKGRVQECPEKRGVHMGASDHTGDKKVDEGRGMAYDGIEHQRHHHENATASDTEEIPVLAVQPGSLCPHGSWGFPAERCFRGIHARHLLSPRLDLLGPALHRAAWVPQDKPTADYPGLQRI